MRNLTLFLFITCVALLSACGSSPKQEKDDKLPTSLEAAVNSPFRSEENKARDQYRHPVETLKFFGLKPDMTVVEISPGAGWYMEILAPYLASEGHYYAAAAPERTKIKTWLDQHPDVAEKTTVTTFAPPSEVDIAPEGSADMVLTFRNVHNWVSKGAEKAAFQAFYKALKPGGILGVAEHRAPAHSKKDPKAKSGYLREKDVIKLAERVGFKLVEKSEINANPKDNANHPKGVWTLPPTLSLKEKDRAKYMSIGESDRMTLKFVRP